MKIFANKSIWKKIVLIFLLIISISFVAPLPAQASVGGELMKPVCDLLVGLGDGVIKIIHIGILGQDSTLLRIHEGGMGSFVNIVLKVAAIAVAICTLVVVAAAIPAVLGAGIPTTLAAGGVLVKGIAAVAGKFAAGAAIAGVMFFASGAFSNQIVLPLYTISPEEIFRNKIPVFDVNFVNPDSNPINSKWINEIKLDALTYGNRLNEEAKTSNGEYRVQQEGETFPTIDEVKNKGTKLEGEDVKKYYNTSQEFSVVPENQYGKVYVYVYKEGDKEYIVKSEPGVGYIYTDSEVMIKVDKNTNTSTNISASNPEDNQIFGISFLLQDTISKGYHNLRIIAIVGMMSVLVYIGIRITISAAAEQKAKYKELLKDWFVGMVLLFSMHYIMNFSNVAVYKLTEVFNSINPTQMIPIIEDDFKGKSGLVVKTLDEYDVPQAVEDRILWKAGEGENSKYVEWHTNLMGAIRIKAEERKDDGTEEAFIGYSLMFVVMVIYTISFAWIYLRRVVYMAFLTLIAPLVALTYPIDKVNDGHAQGFNYWFKEYIFNLLIQPVHLLIYTLLVSSAAELATKHWIYSLVVLGFLVNAEKIVRKMFNFKAENAPGLMSGPVAAGLTMTGMRWLMGHGPKANQNKGNSSEDSKNNIGAANETKMRDLLNGTTTTTTTTTTNNNNNSVENKPTRNKRTISVNNALDDDITSTDLLSDLMSDSSSDSSSSSSTGSSSDSSSSSSTGSSSSSSTRSSSSSSTRLSSDSSSDSSSSSSSGQKIGRWQGFMNGLSNMSNRYISDKKNKIVQDAREGKSLKALTKGAVGVAGGATLGALGLAAGVASGETSKAFQNTAIGAAGGFKLASGMGSYVADDLDFEGLAEAYGRGAMGTEAYDLKQAEKYAEEYASRKDVISTVQKKSKESSWSKSAEKTQELAKIYGVGEGFYDAGLWMKFEKMQDKIRHDSGNRVSIAEARKRAVASKKIHDNFYDKTKSKGEIEKAMMDSMNIDESQARIMSKAMYDWNEILN